MYLARNSKENRLTLFVVEIESLYELYIVWMCTLFFIIYFKNVCIYMNMSVKNCQGDLIRRGIIVMSTGTCEFYIKEIIKVIQQVKKSRLKRVYLDD